jgi:serine/threonine protein kinase
VENIKKPPIPDGKLLQNGRYRILRHLGGGGMGRVYEVVDDELEKSFALKETFYAADEELGEAFKREAQMLAKLEHDAFPQVTHYFTENDGCFLVMELIRGDDLKDLLKARAAPFEQKEVLNWADQILDALEYLHSKNIIHRDIKPDNLKLAPKNKIKLLDLGIAKAKIEGAAEMATILGVAENYSPLEQILYPNSEQAKIFTNSFPLKAQVFINQNSIPQSDIYSLGATLYKLLTNVAPTSATERASAIWSNKPDELKPAHKVNLKISMEVSRVLEKAMNIDFNRRYNSAADMRRALNEAAEPDSNFESVPADLLPSSKESDEETTKLRPQKFKFKSEKPFSATEERDESRLRNKVDTSRRLDELNIKSQKTYKKSSKLKSFLNRGNIITAISIVSILSALGLGISYYFRDQSFNTLRAKNTKNTALAVFSSDGQNIIGYGLGPISIWDADGNNLKEVQIEQGCSGDKSMLSFNGSLIANGTGRTIKICETTSGNLRKTLEEKYYVKDLTFSPDSKTIASLGLTTTITKGYFWQNDTYDYESTVNLWNLENGTAKNIVAKSEPLKSVAFSPDGKTIAISDSYSIKLWDVANGNVRQTISASGSSTIFSPDGKTIANDGSSENEINLYNVIKGNLKQSFKNYNWMPGQNGDVQKLAFSPDGNLIASYSDDELIRVWEIVSGNLRQTLAGHKNVESLGFSPDSKTIITSNGETIKLWRVE